MGNKPEIGPAHSDGHIPVAIHAASKYGIAGHLARLVEWLEITSPQSVRDHLTAIGSAPTDRHSSGTTSAAPGATLRSG